MKAEGLPRRLRLRRRGEFLRVQRSGEKHHTRHFMVFVAPSSAVPGQATADVAGGSHRRDSHDDRSALRLPPTRLGITVTRKVGGAVVRNRIKRCVREAFRRQRRGLPRGLDMVWVAKRVAAAVDCATVAREMDLVAGRLRLRSADPGQSKIPEASR